MDQRYSAYSAFVGIDFGSKLSGTTALALLERDMPLRIEQSEKRRDADEFIIHHLNMMEPGLVALDAPLSLPGVYAYPEEFDDYMFRECDRAVGAMSPLFLGGLTARAMRLARMLRERGWKVIETYPAGLIRHLEIARYLKKEKEIESELVIELAQRLEVNYTSLIPQNYHQVDALLALVSAVRYGQNEAVKIHGRDGTIWL